MALEKEIPKLSQLNRLNRMVIKKIVNDYRTPKGDSAELRSLANTFSRYAQTQQTAYETGVAASSTGTTSIAERTVEHAIVSVLGRSPGSDGLVSTLNDVYPTLSNGLVATSPARSIISAIGSTGPASLMTSSGAALTGQISAEQAALYRQASVIIPDARRVLAGITPFAVVEQPDVVESLRGLIDQALVTLLDESGRVDEPRTALVNDYLGKLRGPFGFIKQFGEIARVDGKSAIPDTYADEQQIASYKLLATYSQQLNDAWKAYIGRSGSAYGDFPLFTERLQRASQMLGVLTQGNVNFMSAMDSVGFAENERRASTSRFEFLDDQFSPTGAFTGEQIQSDLVSGVLRYSTMTVYDFTSWVEKLARDDGPRMLADSGQVGLEFVAGQADTLFLVIAPVLFFAKSSIEKDLSARPVVAQVLAHERVTWAMSDLFNQLDVLADLAA